jgi:hypothetical protein
MSRTAEVKQRLGPIMNRMKASLAKIQKLEESLNLGAQEQPHRGENEDKDETSETKITTTAYAPGRSRMLLKTSMDMLKKKLYRLQHMEDLLRASEDRRQNLQHLFLQTSLSKSAVDSASTTRRNQELERQVAALEKDVGVLEEKCATVDELQHKVVSLSDQVRESQELQTEFDRVTAEKDMFELDLVQRQSKLNEQAIKCDDLECQVEQLTTICNDLLKTLEGEERQTVKLEQELVEARNWNQRTERKRSRPPRTIQSKDSVDSGSTHPTESDNDSSTMESSLGPNNSMEQEYEAIEDDFPNRIDAMKVVADKTSTTVDSSASSDGSIPLPGDVDTSRRSISDDGECSAIVLEGPATSIVEKLMAKIETLDRENAELLLSQREACGKFNGILKENAQQSARIAELEDKLRQGKSQQTYEASVSPQGSEPSDPGKQGRGYFFKQLLQSDAKQLKQLLGGVEKKTEKAQRISQGLAGNAPAKQ